MFTHQFKCIWVYEHPFSEWKIDSPIFFQPQGGYHISPFSWGTNQKGTEGGLDLVNFVSYRKESVLVEQMKREVVNLDKYYWMMIWMGKKNGIWKRIMMVQGAGWRRVGFHPLQAHQLPPLLYQGEDDQWWFVHKVQIWWDPIQSRWGTGWAPSLPSGSWPPSRSNLPYRPPWTVKVKLLVWKISSRLQALRATHWHLFLKFNLKYNSESLSSHVFKSLDREPCALERTNVPIFIELRICKEKDVKMYPKPDVEWRWWSSKVYQQRQRCCHLIVPHPCQWSMVIPDDRIGSSLIVAFSHRHTAPLPLCSESSSWVLLQECWRVWVVLEMLDNSGADQRGVRIDWADKSKPVQGMAMDKHQENSTIHKRNTGAIFCIFLAAHSFDQKNLTRLG